MIGITIGDPNGVGPEILLRTYKTKKLIGNFVAIGDYSVLEFCNHYMELDIALHRMKGMQDYRNNALNIHDTRILASDEVHIGQISKRTHQTGIY